MRPRQKRVLVALGWYDYRLHRGIEKYAQEHGWHLCSDVTKEKVIPWGWEGDGILAWLGAGDDLAEYVVHAKKPTVDFSFRRLNLPYPHVLVDHASCGRIAAGHFMTRGLKNFIFYSSMDNWAYEENGQGFVQALAEAGHKCNWLRWHKSPSFTTGRLQWKHKRSWLAAELRNATKPVGVFAATDDHALEVLEICETANLKVPDDVSIIGMDNSLLAVDAMHTPISSIDPNMEAVGYRGAALLDDLMKGKPASNTPLRVPPAGLIVRKSSDLLATNHKGVATGLRFIWEHYHETISIEQLARVAGMSRRALYTAFIEHVGRTPGEELHRVRIDRARQLLSDSKQKLETVATMCGYQNANSFWVAFKKATGKSPKQYRDMLQR